MVLLAVPYVPVVLRRCTHLHGALLVYPLMAMCNFGESYSKTRWCISHLLVPRSTAASALIFIGRRPPLAKLAPAHCLESSLRNGTYALISRPIYIPPDLDPNVPGGCSDGIPHWVGGLTIIAGLFGACSQNVLPDAV